MTALIELAGITRTFNQGQPSELTVLKGIDMTIERGEFVSVIGASGSGKSTLMNIMGLLDRPTQGTYLLDSVDVLDSSDDELASYRSTRIGFVFRTST